VETITRYSGLTYDWTSSSDCAEKTLNYDGKSNCRQHCTQADRQNFGVHVMYQSCIVCYVTCGFVISRDSAVSFR